MNSEIMNLVEIGLLAPTAIALVRMAWRKPAKQAEFNGNLVEQTTRLPVNFAAQTCSHEWEEVTKQIMDGQFERKLILVLKCKACGLIDKTIETTQPNCKHDWSSTEVTVKSAHEQMASSTYYTPQKPADDNAWVWGKQAVLVRSCKNCGETHETKVENTAFGMKPSTVSSEKA